MSVKISAGVYVSSRRHVGVMGWWIGRVLEVSQNGAFKIQILWSENPEAYKQSGGTCLWGNHGNGSSLVGFYSARKAFRFMRKRKRAFDFDRQFIRTEA